LPARKLIAINDKKIPNIWETDKIKAKR